MKAEHVRWAEALLLERQHGDDSPHVIADRVRALALQGDDNGVRRWIEIANCYDQLQDASGEHH